MVTVRHRRSIDVDLNESAVMDVTVPGPLQNVDDALAYLDRLIAPLGGKVKRLRVARA